MSSRRRRQAAQQQAAQQQAKKKEEETGLEKGSFKAAHSEQQAKKQKPQFIGQEDTDRPIIQKIMNDRQIESFRRIIARSYKCHEIDITYERHDPFLIYYLTRIDGTKKQVFKINYTGQRPKATEI